MKHLHTFESDRRSLLTGLEQLGFEPYVGFMYWMGTPENELGFVVIGADETSCVKQLQKHLYDYLPSNSFGSSGGFSGTSGGFPGKKENLSMEDFMVDLFSRGKINDAGFYRLKSKNSVALVEVFYQQYIMNPKFVWDKAKEYFSNAEEVFSQEIPESKIYYRDPKR